jgi:hypothetical protein
MNEFTASFIVSATQYQATARNSPAFARFFAGNAG